MSDVVKPIAALVDLYLALQREHDTDSEEQHWRLQRLFELKEELRPLLRQVKGTYESANVSACIARDGKVHIREHRV